MSFNLEFPTSNGPKPLEVNTGEILFVLGPNGSGKSSIMLHFYRPHQNNAVKISAYRQNWMLSDLPDITLSTANSFNYHLSQHEFGEASRYRDTPATQGQRPTITLLNLANQDNERSRRIAKAYEDNDQDVLKNFYNDPSHISKINDLFEMASLNIEIGIGVDSWFWASKNGSEKFSISKLSDGERNALLIAADVLNAKSDSLILIDEPERHLHRSIVGPLLIQLFNFRPDCGFVISTHDSELPLLSKDAKTLLVRSCNVLPDNTVAWDADLISSGEAIPDDLKRDLLGARRKLLFVEGIGTSLDRPLYNLLFPEASVIPKGDCREVERAVAGVRATESLNWLSAYGIVDSDGFDQSEIDKKREKYVYAVPYYSVEAIYYHPNIIRKIAQRTADTHGGDAEAMIQAAIDGAINAIAPNDVARLTKNGAKKVVNKTVFGQIPDDDELMKMSDPIIINFNSILIHNNKIGVVNKFIENKDWLNILYHCKIRESNAPNAIITNLNFKNRSLYERAVIKLINDCQETRDFARGLFADLFGKLSQDASGF